MRIAPAEPYDGQPAVRNHATYRALRDFPVFGHIVDSQEYLASRRVMASMTAIWTLSAHLEVPIILIRLQGDRLEPCGCSSDAPASEAAITNPSRQAFGFPAVWRIRN